MYEMQVKEEVTSKTVESGNVEVTLHLGLPTSLLCHASFILATDKHIELKEVAPPNPIKSIKKEHFTMSLMSLLGNVGGTLGMFIGFSFIGMSESLVNGLEKFGKLKRKG